MPNTHPASPNPLHLRITEPSPWVRRFAPLIREDGTVLDIACGGGRHARYFLALGHAVAMVDRDTGPVGDLVGQPRAEIIEADLEGDAPWPLAERTFAAVVVVNYLHRPLLPRLIASLEDGGVLIYETFARGNEHFSRPRNPDHLLKSGELLEAVRGKLQVVAYEHGIDERTPLPGVKQRLCAINARSSPDRDDGEPEPRPVFPT